MQRPRSAEHRVTAHKALSTLRVNSAGLFAFPARTLHCPDMVPYCRRVFEKRRQSPDSNGQVLGSARAHPKVACHSCCNFAAA